MLVTRPTALKTQHGLSPRWTYPDFFNRYRVLLKKKDMMSPDKKLVCKNLLETLIKVRNVCRHCFLGKVREHCSRTRLFG